jgi:hypothetical protein
MTDEERRQIKEAACRYVREQAPTPPVPVVERVARIVLQARTSQWQVERTDRNPHHPTSARSGVTYLHIGDLCSSAA